MWLKERVESARRRWEQETKHKKQVGGRSQTGLKALLRHLEFELELLSNGENDQSGICG